MDLRRLGGSVCGDIARGECCEDGLVIRMGGKQDSRALTCVISLLFLGWSFQGVAIVADVFMAAIEKVTTRRVRKWNAKLKRFTTTTVWNSTVANLTLMALGSSAPEIMLNVIGIFKDDFQVQPLGPATIVGSAAFNLLMIVAVCIVSVPADEQRRIKGYSVFVCTAVWSIFAYVWLLVILRWSSEMDVEIWEAVLTFMFFPILVYMSYALDIRGKRDQDQDADEGKLVLSLETTPEELAELELKIRKEHGMDLTDEQVAKFMQVECGTENSRAKYRIAATRQIFGGKKVKTTDRWSLRDEGADGALDANRGKDAKVVPLTEDSEENAHSNKPDFVKMEFSTPKYAVLESAGHVELKLMRVRNSDATKNCKVTVHYKTRDGLAKAGEDYDALESTVVFEPGVDEQIIKVEIINDNAYEEDEEFYVDLSNPIVEGGTCQVELGESATVTIIDDDLPGMVLFGEDHITIDEKMEDQEILVKVCRRDGCSNAVSFEYRTEAGTALEGRDFEKARGKVTFEHGEIRKDIPITIKGKGRFEITHNFRLVLEGDVTGGGKFDPKTDGGADSCICTIEIQGKEASNLLSILRVRLDKAKVGHSNWGDQFKEAWSVTGGGGDDDDEEEESGPPTIVDYVFHYIALPWKLIFAFCPPTDYCGGWVCFCGSLFFIGAVTVLIGDLAELFGCALGIEDLVTAITFVALGTSLPDTFASRAAALQDATADASIVNVTGSNSVNVFLGIGLPWMIGAIQWRVTKGIPMRVESGSMLGFSIGIFCCCAFGCLSLLVFRRQYFGAELGGGGRWPSAVFLVCLWLCYVAVSALKSTEAI